MVRAALSAVSLCVVVLVGSGCGSFSLVGSGNVVEEPRAVGPWKTVRVEAGIRATVVKGEPGVVLTADDNVLPEVETVLEGTTLVLRLRPYTSVVSAHGIQAVVSGDVLEGVAASGAAVVTGEATPTPNFAVTASGSSTVRVTGIEASTARADVSGASTVTANGRATSLAVVASGASTFAGSGFALDRATVSGSGASSLWLTVRTAVEGDVSGGSRLTVAGGARSSVSASGGSTVTLDP